MNQTDQHEIPIFLLPGLNGDPRIFARQVDAYPNATFVSWIAPMPCESLADYGRRVAESLATGKECIVAGVSFGGIVAMEVARHLHAKACVVIASTRNVRGLPLGIRLLRPVAAITPSSILQCAVRGGFASAAQSPRFRGRIWRLSAEEKAFRRWALKALLNWNPVEAPGCPVFQIHGDCDREFPSGRHTADRVLPYAGHLLSLTHGVIVNEFLNEIISRVSQNEAESSCQ